MNSTLNIPKIKEGTVIVSKFPKENVVCMKERSEVTDYSKHNLMKEFKQAIKQSGAKKVFVDLTDANLPNSAYRKQIMQAFSSVKIEKVAVFTEDKALEFAATAIFKLTKLKNYKVFKNKEAAFKWLLNL